MSGNTECGLLLAQLLENAELWRSVYGPAADGRLIGTVKAMAQTNPLHRAVVARVVRLSRAGAGRAA